MWTKTYSEEIGHHWLRTDGAVVKKNEGYSSRPWLPNFREWLAYAPDENFPLSYSRKNSRLNFARYFKTEKSAMKKLDQEFPISN